MKQEQERPVVWMPGTLATLKSFPERVQDEIGYALSVVQWGHRPTSAKQLTGFSEPVIELISDFSKNTYRVCYTVAFENAVYVLHSFQKKSTHGINTPKHIVDLIKQRLNQARQHHQSASK